LRLSGNLWEGVQDQDGMRKLAICGKGGSGKSTIVALLARGLRDRGYQVLVIDSDESNPGLYRRLGFDQRPEALLELVGGKKQVFPTFSSDSGRRESVLTRSEIKTADLPEDYILHKDGIGLVCVGKILQSLEGCACPMGALSREFLKRLSLEEDEVAIVDMEAGIEHFGRGVEASIDSVLVVAEPSLDSLELTEKIHTLAAEVGVEQVWTMLNKVTSEDIRSRLTQQLEDKGIPVIGTIAHDAEIFLSGLEGRPAHSADASREIDRILAILM